MTKEESINMKTKEFYLNKWAQANSPLQEGEEVKQLEENPAYFISNYATLFELAQNGIKVCTPRKVGNYWGYYVKGFKNNPYAHRLVAQYFVPRGCLDQHPFENLQVHHKTPFDINKTNYENNCSENLQWILKGVHGLLNQTSKSYLTSTGELVVGKQETPVIYKIATYKSDNQSLPYITCYKIDSNSKKTTSSETFPLTKDLERKLGIKLTEDTN